MSHVAPQGADNRERWLAAIRRAEGTEKEGGKPGDAYKIMFGGETFDNTKPGHPDTVVISNKYASAAAGAYQFMPFTWKEVTRQLGLPPNSPMTKENQDKAATYLAKKRGVDINTAPFTQANLAKLAPEWASFPTMAGVSYYGQPVKSYKELLSVFNNFKPPTFVERVNTRLDKMLSPGERANLDQQPLVIPKIRRTEENPLKPLLKIFQ